MPDFEGTSGHYNRDMNPGFFVCHIHDDHDAECFVVVQTGEGDEAIPICRSGVISLVKSLTGAQGIRSVSPLPVDSYHGTIFGFASRR